MPSNVYIENWSPEVRLAGGVLTKKNLKVTGGVGVVDFSGAASVNMGSTPIGANAKYNAPIDVYTPVAINATATATAAQLASGYITSTSASATTITLPTATAFGTQIGATQGTIFIFTVDNTAGANTVTIAVGSGMTASALATAFATSSGLLTIPSGTTGQGTFQLMFSSATACTYTRVA